MTGTGAVNLHNIISSGLGWFSKFISFVYSRRIFQINKTVIILCTALMVIAGPLRQPLAAQTDSTVIYQPQKKDSTDYYRQKYRGKKAWEHAVSLPGTIISIPFVAFFKLQELFIGYVYETKLIPKVRNLVEWQDGTSGIVPKFSNRKGYGIKLYKEQILSRTDDLSLTVTGNVFIGRERYRLRWRNIQMLNSPFYLNMMGRYRNLPDERFFGIGPDTERSDKSFYTQENTAFEGGIDIRTSPSFVINTVLRIDYDNIYEANEEPSVTDIFDEETLPGLETKVRIAQARLGFFSDTRNRLGNSSAGHEFGMWGTVFKDITNGPYNFWKVQGDYRKYINLGLNRVLALRFGFEMTEPFESGDEVPFYYLSELGVSTSIRGYDRGRFRDFDMMLASVEYRIPIWRSIDFTAFTDAGQVANDLLSDFRLKKLRLGFGAGVRLYSSKDLVANVQAAFSREKFRFIIDLN